MRTTAANRKPDWRLEGRDWPNRGASRFVEAGGIAWHVQVMGSGPPLLLLHGTGAATHSWRDLAPILARDFTVVAPDLPGHGFTATPGGAGLSLPGMSAAVAALLAELDVTPKLVVGHSAGAAIALRLSLDGRITPDGIVSINGALKPFPGLAGILSPALAGMLFINPLMIGLFAHRAAQPGRVAQLMASTGSPIDAAGLDHYAALLRTTGHIAGALGMMSRWDLHALQGELPALAAPLLLIVGERDRAVPPDVARAVSARVPQAEVVELAGVGHLAHEEQPNVVADLILARAAAWGAARGAA